jgi:MoaA/NifB/PqqE/SkfB family radical SAM enzyme
MEVNKRCNLRCTHCDFWQRDDADQANYFTMDQKLAVMDSFAAMNPSGSLVICGGEPMLDLETYFGMCRGARDRGLRALSVVNGTRIRRAEMAERLVREGPHEISISLNSHLPDLHDETRGVPGAFDKAVTALRLLVAAKKKLGATDTRIYVMGLIYKRNHRMIDAFYDFVLNDIGADQLKLNFIQPSFGQMGEVDTFFDDEGTVDAPYLAAQIRAADAKYGLDLNPSWVENVEMYFDSLGGILDRRKGWASGKGTRDHICNSYDRNVMINHYGVARLCFSDQFAGQALSEPDDFRKFWQGAGLIRAQMRKCNQYCGISHSVRRESSTQKGRAKMDTHEQTYGTLPGTSPMEKVKLRLQRLTQKE